MIKIKSIIFINEILLIIILIPLAINSQIITYDKAFDFSINYAFQTVDGGTIIGGYEYSHLILVKLNKNGLIEWQKSFASTAGLMKSPFLFPTTNDFFVATSNLNSYNSLSKVNPKLIKLDYEGNILLEKIYETSSSGIYGYQLIEADDGYYFFLTDDGLYKINSEGDTLWLKESIPVINYEKLKNFILKISNDFYLLLNIGSVVSIDRDGNTLWEMEFSPSINIYPVFIKSIDEMALIFYKNMMLKVNKNGELMQQLVLKNSGHVFYASRKDNNIFLLYDAETESDYYSLITLESDSIIVSEKNLTIEAVQVIPTDDGGFLFMGNKDFTPWLMKTDSVLYHKSVTLKYPGSPDDPRIYESSYNQIYGLQQYDIIWDCSEVNNINLDYSTDAGINWVNIASNLSCDSSFYPPIGWNYGNYPFYEWTAPAIFSDKFYLRVTDNNDPSVYDRTDPVGSIFIYQEFDTISVNNITMWIGNNGMGSHDPRTERSGFYWPGGNSATIPAIFMDGLVWGGKINGEIRVNGNTYRAGLQPGKILDDGTADNPLATQCKIFKIRKDWQLLPEGIMKDRLEYDYNHWPIEAGAPWDDVNEDGVYTPGFDKPKFIGDETLFYIVNDLDTAASKFTYGSDPIGLEFQTTVFGFNRADLKDVVFKKYKVINKSHSDIEDMYFTYWADVDLGYAGDDYEGFDSTYNMAYVYNGDNNDEGYYGLNPPALAHMIVQGPHVPASDQDSARYENGWKVGFKNLGITSSGMIVKSSNIYPGDVSLGVYQGSIEFYNVMRGLRNDGADVINPITGESTIWPLSGDPVEDIGWYEGEGWPGGPSPNDQRYHSPTGPFNLAAGDTQEIVIAIPIARGTDNINSITKLRELAAHVQEFYNTELVEILNTKETITPTGFTLSQNYPNPFNPKTTIEYEVPEKSNVTIKIYDILGREIKTLVDNEEKVRWKYKVEFDATNFASGVYFYRIQANPVSGVGSFTQTKKMVVLK